MAAELATKVAAKAEELWAIATAAENRAVTAGVAGAALLGGLYYLLSKRRPQVVKGGKFKGIPVPAGAFDAVIVGGGPSGRVMAYYATKVGPVKRPPSVVLRGGSQSLSSISLASV